jgi:N6-adenosine-specific RNA methylase IME4
MPRARFMAGRIEDLGKMVREGRKFGSIGSDPQWKFLTRSAAGEGRSANIHYKTEEVDKIKNLPVGELLADDGAFYMWMVDWCPQDALDLLAHYGLRHVTTAFTWIKTNGIERVDPFDNATWHMGQGYWTRCLTGSTNVHIFDVTDQTVKKVPLINLRFRPTWSFLIWSHTGWRRVRDFVECGSTSVSKISTRIGTATSSNNHRWAVKRLRTFTRKHLRRHVIEYQDLAEIDRLRLGHVSQSGQSSVNFVFSNTPIEHPFPTGRYGEFDLSEDIGWLIGLFCAEGNFGTGSHRSHIRFSLHRKEIAIADRIAAIVDKLSMNGDRFFNIKIKSYRHFTKRGNGLAVYFTSAAVKDLIQAFIQGEGAHGKRLALDRLLQAPVAFRRGLLHGMLEGDGTKGAHGYAGFRNLRLCNAALIDDFSELARGLGIITSALEPKITKSKLAGDWPSFGLRFASPRNKLLELDGCAVTPIEINDIAPAGSESTFDICVDGHAFVADWMVSHNSNPEQCWLATKGNPKRLYADVRQLIVAPVMEHSRKPDAWLDRIERLTSGDYLEMQARRTRPGWVSWGDEVEFTGVAA